MHTGAEAAGPAAAAILHWWRGAGVDVDVADDPLPWGAPAAEAPPAPPEPRAAARTRATAPAHDPFHSVTTLDELRALVAARSPGAPFADGNPQSGLMLVGEAPSAEDLRTGRPFSGPAGQLLDRMLAAIGLDRQSAYIALLCPELGRPGPPPPDAIAAALPLARAHIRLAQPRLLLLLGGNPVGALTGSTDAIGRVRGRWLQVDAGAGPVAALATYNPAYLLRRPEDKRLAWADLLELKQRLHT